MLPERTKIKIAGTGDLHIGSQNGFPKSNELKDAFAEISLYVDGIVICGDFTEDGLPVQAAEAAEFLASLNVPIIGVLGNHDRREGRESEIKKILSRENVIMLEGQTHTVQANGRKITFMGTEGSWQFGKTRKTTNGHWADSETEKLKKGLQDLEPGINIVVLHYPPIITTALPKSWIPHSPTKFSYIEQQLDYFKTIITAVMHGHSHEAAAEGQTEKGIVVYNVAIPVVERLHNGNNNSTRFFRIIEV